MSARYGRTGRTRPASGGWEVAIWYLMRVTGLGLFVLVLSHYLILHVLYDPAQQHSGWIAEMRWSSTFWRGFDWLMLMLVLFHGFMGMRIVVTDYSSGGTRVALTTGIYILGVLLLVMGTIVVMTLPTVVPSG